MSDPRHDAHDFWGRRRHHPRHERAFTAVGRVVTVASDRPELLEVVDHAEPAYSAAPASGSRLRVELVCPEMPGPPEALPADLFDRITYVGHGDWLALDLGGLGHIQVDLAAGLARGVLAPALAARPDEVARCVLHTVTTNFLLADGLAMVHGAALVREHPEGPEVALLVGPDGAGKSTAALRLVGSGWALLCESIVYIEEIDDALRLSGFPVGIARLRADTLDAARGLPVLEERVRGETKYRVDLRGHPGAVWEQAVTPARVVLVLMEGRSPVGGAPEAFAPEPADALARNSLYFDGQPRWDRNLALLDRLLEASRVVTLGAGAHPHALFEAVGGGLP